MVKHRLLPGSELKGDPCSNLLLTFEVLQQDGLETFSLFWNDSFVSPHSESCTQYQILVLGDYHIHTVLPVIDGSAYLHLGRC